MENSEIRAREREGRDRTRQQDEFCLTSPEGEGKKNERQKRDKKESPKKKKNGELLTFSAFLAASASDRLSKLTNPTG